MYAVTLGIHGMSWQTVWHGRTERLGAHPRRPCARHSGTRTTSSGGGLRRHLWPQEKLIQ
eukprot:325253-Pyramimonas_sp.AAC.1